MIDLFICSHQNTNWNGRGVLKDILDLFQSVQKVNASIPDFQPFLCALSNCHGIPSATTCIHFLLHGLSPSLDRRLDIRRFLFDEMLATLNSLIRGGSRLLRFL